MENEKIIENELDVNVLPNEEVAKDTTSEEVSENNEKNVKEDGKVEENSSTKKEKEYVPNRFEFAVYVNEFPICKRNFKINFFNEQSLYSIQMKHQLDNIVELIKNDLKSKSRLYLWYYTYDDVKEGELYEPLIEENRCTFRFVISDNGKEMLSRIWDGRYYPKAIREKVDLSNKYIELNGKKIELGDIDEKKLPVEGYISRIIVQNRQDLIVQIIKMICEVCSPENISIDEDGTVHKSGEFTSDQDYDLVATYETAEPIVENGDIVGKKVLDSKKYILSKFQRYMKLCSDLAVGYEKKTKEYFENECNGMFNSFRTRRN